MDEELVGDLIAGLPSALPANIPLARTSSRMRPARSARCAASSASVISVGPIAGAASL
jgi:hypothetical protein